MACLYRMELDDVTPGCDNVTAAVRPMGSVCASLRAPQVLNPGKVPDSGLGWMTVNEFV